MVGAKGVSASGQRTREGECMRESEQGEVLSADGRHRTNRECMRDGQYKTEEMQERGSVYERFSAGHDAAAHQHAAAHTDAAVVLTRRECVVVERAENDYHKVKRQNQAA
jgi:hypothetical protein